MIDTGAEPNVILESLVADKIRRFTKKKQKQKKNTSNFNHMVVNCSLPKVNSQHIHTRKTKKSKSTWIVVDEDDLPGSSINFVSCNLAESLGIITFNTPSMEIKGSLIKSMGTKTALTDDATELKKNFFRPPIARIITEHPSVFHGLGKMKAEPIQLYVKPIAPRVIQPQGPSHST